MNIHWCPATLLLLCIARIASAGPASDTVDVLVSTEAISVRGGGAVATAAVLRDKGTDWKILPIYKELLSWKSQQERLGRTGTWKGICLLDVAPAVTFAVVKKVMYTCAIVGYSNCSFAGRHDPLQSPANPGQSWPLGGESVPVIIVNEQDYTLRAGKGEPVTIGDDRGLAHQLAALKRTHPKEQQLSLRIDDRVPYSRLTEVMDLVGAAGFPNYSMTDRGSDGIDPGRLPTDAKRGSLDKELIRRVIRKHAGNLRRCFEIAPSHSAELDGRILVQFVIAGSGDVAKAVVDSSTMGDAEVERCIVATVKTMKFPKPAGGGVVVVTYPFVLRAGTER